ncbi:MAG: hypothetical protein ACI4L6_02070 [Candidatus Onthoplasma sp.]
MIKRDFSKSSKEYFKENKIPFIVLTALIVVGIIIASIFGFNGNFEMKGYNQIEISVAEDDNYSLISKTAGQIVNSFGGDFDSTQIAGVGDNTIIIVRYMNDLSALDQQKVNEKISDSLSIEITKISGHKHVQKIVQAKDYIYTIASILIISLVAVIFAYARYNGASGLALLLSNLLGTLAFVSVSAILRLEIGLSYFAMLVALNLIIIYFAIEIFEHMKKESWLSAKDYATALESAMKSTKFRFSFISIAVMLVGLLFVLFAPTTIKYTALNIMFIPVVCLATVWYVLPFVWNLLIPKCRQRLVKVKTADTGKK